MRRTRATRDEDPVPTSIDEEDSPVGPEHLGLAVGAGGLFSRAELAEQVEPGNPVSRS